MSSHRRTRAAAAVAAVALALAGLGACSSSGGVDAGDDPATTTTAATPPEETTTVPEDTTTTTAVDEPDDPDVDPDIDPDELDDARDRVERINLTIDDLPEGWTSEPNEDSDDSVFDSCSDVDVDAHTVADAGSDTFTLSQDGGALTLETSTGYLDDESVAVDIMAELASDAFASCASDGLLDAGAGVTVEGELMPTSGLPELGDEATALQGDLVLSDADETAQASILVIAIRTDQVVTILTAVALNTPGDEQLLYGLLDVIAERQEL